MTTLREALRGALKPKELQLSDRGWNYVLLDYFPHTEDKNSVILPHDWKLVLPEYVETVHGLGLQFWNRPYTIPVSEPDAVSWAGVVALVNKDSPDFFLLRATPTGVIGGSAGVKYEFLEHKSMRPKIAYDVFVSYWLTPRSHSHPDYVEHYKVFDGEHTLCHTFRIYPPAENADGKLVLDADVVVRFKDRKCESITLDQLFEFSNQLFLERERKLIALRWP